MLNKYSLAVSSSFRDFLTGLRVKWFRDFFSSKMILWGLVSEWAPTKSNERSQLFSLCIPELLQTEFGSFALSTN
jgi:hypothetical protein